MNRLYDENLYRFAEPQPSYWEASAKDVEVNVKPLAGDESCDVAIIGGGYTGLSAALHLARDYNIDVRVLEAGHFGWGASGRNGGFVCPGGTGTGMSDLIRLVGLENAKEYSRASVDAVNLVHALGDEEDIDFQAFGSAEVCAAHTAKAFSDLQKDYAAATSQLGLDYELVSAAEFRERFFDCSELHGGLLTRPTFGLHPLRYCRGLANAAQRRGAVLHDRSQVIDWSKTDDGIHRLSTAGGNLRARRVIYATNGFIDEGLNTAFKSRTLPIISAIIVTRPLTGEELAAHSWVTDCPAYNSRRVMNYYRLLPDNRFLLGGRAHGKGDPDDEQETYAGLTNMLGHLWPEWAGIEVDYRWQGLICFTGSLVPSIGQLDDDNAVFFGFGYHGNGVNTATWSGKQLADWIGTGSSERLPTMVKGLGRKFPLASMRLRYLRAGIALSSWLDRRG